jgi:lambda family phage portal protein
VIGTGLKLKSRIDAAALGIGAEAADALEKRLEAEFALWANEKTKCDAAGVNDFAGMQQLAFLSWQLSGDCFAVVERTPATARAPYGLRLRVIEADRVSTPKELANWDETRGTAKGGNQIFDGVELDGFGTVTAYYVNNGYNEPRTWTRVEANDKKTGLPNILHIMDAERPEQYRGVSALAQIIEPVLQLRRYTKSELDAAVYESMLFGYVTTSAENFPGFTGDAPPDAPQAKEPKQPPQYDLESGTVTRLDPGEDMKFFSPERPGGEFSNFTHAISEQIGAALEEPADLILKSFSKSYSASRAALLEAWKSFKMRRAWFVSDFCRPVYELWLSEAAARGRIRAPGFFNDPLARAAWLGAEWIGPAQGQLDPVKEIQAELLAIGAGITTREQATAKLNGGNWDDNVRQIARENALLAEANKTRTEEGTNGNET